MEREGFKCCLRKIKIHGQIKAVVRDCHIGIRADRANIKREYPEVEHHFDVWHLSSKNLTEKAKKKDCAEFLPWIKSISNHLWLCAETCKGVNEMLREKWTSVVHRTTSIHS